MFTDPLPQSSAGQELGKHVIPCIPEPNDEVPTETDEGNDEIMDLYEELGECLSDTEVAV